ncbi:MAG: hypothetical protein JWL71_3687 [Acidobacteria bacterium]|nr:hypothetical protein [Acidobacteriota bacterium]
MLRLSALNPALHDNGFLSFDCPVGHPHRITIPISPEADPRPWAQTGEFPDSLSLTPSVLAHTAAPNNPDLLGAEYDAASLCGWHGFITNGEVTTC